METLDRIARSGEAVFATDSGERIILWNKKCEALLGRDVFGNIYCHRSCPVAFQARERPEDPVRRFPLFIAVGDGGHRQFDVGLIAVPSGHAALSIVVHVEREGAEKSPLEARLARERAAGEPLWPLTTRQGQPVDLISREREILRCLARGMSGSAVGEKLFISRATVRNHIQHVLEKLGVHNKLAAVAFAYRHDLIGPERADEGDRPAPR